MLEISRTALFGKLNPLAYKAIEGATVFCKLRGNPYVELAALAAPDPATRRIPTCTGSSSTTASTRRALASDLTAALDRLPRGATLGDRSLRAGSRTRSSAAGSTAR